MIENWKNDIVISHYMYFTNVIKNNTMWECSEPVAIVMSSMYLYVVRLCHLCNKGCLGTSKKYFDHQPLNVILSSYPVPVYSRKNKPERKLALSLSNELKFQLHVYGLTLSQK